MILFSFFSITWAVAKRSGIRNEKTIFGTIKDTNTLFFGMDKWLIFTTIIGLMIFLII